MSVRTIRTGDDPCLRKKCRPVTVFNEKLKTLIEDLIDTMRDKDGVLAALVVGVIAFGIWHRYRSYKNETRYSPTHRTKVNIGDEAE